MSNRPLNSAIVIARLLDTEGFTDHTANQIERYWRRNAGLTERQQQKLQRLESAMGELASRLSTGDRMVLGKFIGLHKKMSFDTGLRIGLTCMAVTERKDYDEREIAGFVVERPQPPF